MSSDADDDELPEFHEAIICPYCKHRSIVSPVQYNEDDDEPAVYFSADRLAWMAECACGGILLLIDPKGDDKPVQVFPHPLPEPTDPRVPDHLREVFDEAQVCFMVGAKHGAAVLARRTVELACEELGSGVLRASNLAAMIDELAQLRVLTTDHQEAAHAVRLVGNAAVHGRRPEDRVSEQDVVDILELAKMLLQVFVDRARTRRIREGRAPSGRGS